MVKPRFEAGGGDLARSPAWQLFEDSCPDEVNHGPPAEAGEAQHLGEGDRGDRLGLVSLGLGAGKPARLHRGASDEPGAAGVGLGVKLQVATEGEEPDGGEGQLELAGGGRQLHGALVQGADALVFGPQDVGLFVGEGELPAGGVLVDGETEVAHAAVQLVVAHAELLGQIREPDLARELVALGWSTRAGRGDPVNTNDLAAAYRRLLAAAQAISEGTVSHTVNPVGLKSCLFYSSRLSPLLELSM